MLRSLFVVLLLAVSPVRADSFWQRVHWMTPDGVMIVGQYHPASRPGSMTWVLLHGLGSVGGEWNHLAERMGEMGCGILVYDARGHGESTHTLLGQDVNYKSWRSIGPGTPWDMMTGDLGIAVQMLQKEWHVPEKTIAVGGASLGANVALVYASGHALVPALLLLSPGLEYAGLQTPVAYNAYKGRPVFIASSPGDAYAAASVRQLSMLAPSPVQVVVDGKAGHGVQMLDKEFTQKVLGWMKQLHGNRNRRPT